MHVLVTGGTGYVGSHTVAAVRAEGHTVRVLARGRDRVFPALRPLGIDTGQVEVAIGDVCDLPSVEEAVRGCDAVVHAGGVQSGDSRVALRAGEVNVRGTANVLGAARRAGADPIVHVSSVAALLPGRERPLRESSLLGESRCATVAAKIEAERIARRMQDEGAPVVITYPGAVFGPHDPHFGDNTHYVSWILKGLVPFLPTGGIPVVDVRDVATVHARILEAGRGPRRYLATAEYLEFRDLARRLERLRGRLIPRVVLPVETLLPVACVTDRLQRLLSFRLPIDHESLWMLCCRATCDNGHARASLGVWFRAVDVTLADTVRWLRARGIVSARQAGALAAA
jgi:dihydroflavonol-4-reductase